MKLQLLSFMIFLIISSAYSINKNHTVEKGDTLLSIAYKYNTSADLITNHNKILNDIIYIGQILSIPSLEPDKYIVKNGDTLLGIAKKENITIKHLLQVNRIDEKHKIKIGDVLTVPTTPELKKEYIVQKGDTLSWISMAYNIEVDKIIELNKLEDKEIKIGLKLKLVKDTQNIKTQKAAISIPGFTNQSQKNQDITYVVKNGDTLTGLAKIYKTTITDIKKNNNLKSSVLKIGQQLKLPIAKYDYVVKKGDTLLAIAIQHNTTLDQIKKYNNLQSNKIKIGQKITVPETIKKRDIKPSIPKEEKLSYTVVKGDTLSAIALNFQTTVKDIKKENNLINETIYIGKVITLPAYAKKREPIDYNIYHTVKKGDTLSAISLTYDISETLLKEINHLDSDKIRVNQKIKLIPQDSRTHKIQKGDTLWSIAKKYNVSVDQLIQYNHLNSTVAQVGKVLNIYDYRVANHLITENSIRKEQKEKKNNLNLVSLKYSHDSKDSQPYKNYSVGSLNNPLQKYKQAKDKWKEFTTSINNEKLISNDLEGITIVLDPGHGGKDPGAIASVQSGDDKLFIVEDEYAYDTTVRLYELLKRNGANVFMTVLSPDHVARNPKINTTTFINKKNEIYNNYQLNKTNKKTIWPVGGQWGLNQRVKITNSILSSTKSKKTIFISIHADNDIERGKGKLILYDERNSVIDKKSKFFADNLIKNMGSDAATKGMSLAVFSQNNAELKILVELRNMAHLSEAVALLDSEKRQKDAQLILDGIKNYISSDY